MRLTFLGNAYDASLPTVEATEMQETATFLGKHYTRKQYTVAQRHQPSETLMYRGVRYNR